MPVAAVSNRLIVPDGDSSVKEGTRAGCLTYHTEVVRLPKRCKCPCDARCGCRHRAQLKTTPSTNPWRARTRRARVEALFGQGSVRAVSNELASGVLIGACIEPSRLAFQALRMYTGWGNCRRSRGERSGKQIWPETSPSLFCRGRTYPRDHRSGVQYRPHRYSATTTKRISSNTLGDLDCLGSRYRMVGLVLFDGSGDTGVSTYVVRPPRTWVG